jgi:hypothetical protein
MVLWGNERYQESLHETEQCLRKAPNFGGADTYRAMILIYAKGSDQQVVKIDGMVTTTMKDGQPNTTFKGSRQARPWRLRRHQRHERPCSLSGRRA